MKNNKIIRYAVTIVTIISLGCDSEKNMLNEFQDGREEHGTFATVRNQSNDTIWVEKTRGFGREMRGGTLLPGSAKSSGIYRFKDLDGPVELEWWIGDRTRPENETDIFRETIQVKTVMKNRETLVFTLNPDHTWDWHVENLVD